MFKQKLTPQQALQKAKYFCAYQERCHFEVKEKLYSFGLYKKEVEEVTAQLIEENYLNEERYAGEFVHGKFSSKQWGKIKIEFVLKQKKISHYNIKKALKTIDDAEYEKTLLKLASAKWNSLKHEQYLNRLLKTKKYLLQKGYEIPMIEKAIFNREASSPKCKS
jgi:regulatory protein